MADMVAGQDIAGAGWKVPEIDNLCPAYQEEDPSNQPPAEMGEQSLSSKHGGGNRSCRSSGVREVRNELRATLLSDCLSRTGLRVLQLLNSCHFSKSVSPPLPIHQNHAGTTSPDRDRLICVQAQVGFPFCQRTAFDHEKNLVVPSPPLRDLRTAEIVIESDPKNTGGELDIWMAIGPVDRPLHIEEQCCLLVWSPLSDH